MDGKGKIYIKSYLRKVTYNKTVIFLVPLKISSMIFSGVYVLVKRNLTCIHLKRLKIKKIRTLIVFYKLLGIIVDVKFE